MNSNTETAISVVGGFITTAMVSNHLFDQMAMKTLIAVLTGFFGALAGLLAKMLFNYIKNLFSKNP